MMKKKLTFFIVIILLIFFVAVFWNRSYTKIVKNIYPVKYSAFVNKYAAQYNIEPSLIYAVIKNESSFNPKAESRIGALGLMQLTPETFSWAQSKTGTKQVFSTEELYEPEINIHYGTVVLSQFLKEFHRTDTALAAYHAGRSNVKKWLSNSKYSMDGQKLDYIPFDDTRSYVKKVLKAKQMYESLYYKK